MRQLSDAVRLRGVMAALGRAAQSPGRVAKIERGHEHDRRDVGEIIARGLVERDRLGALFDATEPALYRYPGDRCAGLPEGGA